MQLNLLLPPKKIFLTLLVILLALQVVSLLGQVSRFFLGHGNLMGLIPLVHVDAEQNIPTYYSVLAILFAAMLLAVITAAKRKQGDAYVKYWLGLALIFVLLSMDEFMMLHEMISTPIRDRLDPGGWLHNLWVYPAGLLVLIFAAFYLKFLLNLPRRTAILFVIGGIVFVTGALGMEAIGGYRDDLLGRFNFVSQVIAHIEEFCEMTGIAIFIYALLDYMQEHIGPTALNINFGSKSNPS